MESSRKWVNGLNSKEVRGLEKLNFQRQVFRNCQQTEHRLRSKTGTWMIKGPDIRILSCIMYKDTLLCCFARKSLSKEWVNLILFLMIHLFSYLLLSSYPLALLSFPFSLSPKISLDDFGFRWEVCEMHPYFIDQIPPPCLEPGIIKTYAWSFGWWCHYQHLFLRSVII